MGNVGAPDTNEILWKIILISINTISVLVLIVRDILKNRKEKDSDKTLSEEFDSFKKSIKEDLKEWAENREEYVRTVIGAHTRCIDELYTKVNTVDKNCDRVANKIDSIEKRCDDRFSALVRDRNV